MATLNLVLVEPEIPQNTGNVARTCAATGTRLHLVKPMGFEPDDKKLKRAGLDYWHLLDITYYENIDDFFEKTKGGKFRVCPSKFSAFSNISSSSSQIKLLMLPPGSDKPALQTHVCPSPRQMPDRLLLQ